MQARAPRLGQQFSPGAQSAAAWQTLIPGAAQAEAQDTTSPTMQQTPPEQSSGPSHRYSMQPLLFAHCTSLHIEVLHPAGYNAAGSPYPAQQICPAARLQVTAGVERWVL